MSSLRSVATVTLALACLAGARGDAQQDPSLAASAPTAPAAQEDSGTQDEPASQDEPQQPVFRGGINFVRVDAIVSDDDGIDPDEIDATTKDGLLGLVRRCRLGLGSRVPLCDRVRRHSGCG